jgi:hypothetical protein
MKGNQGWYGAFCDVAGQCQEPSGPSDDTADIGKANIATATFLDINSVRGGYKLAEGN